MRPSTKLANRLLDELRKDLDIQKGYGIPKLNKGFPLFISEKEKIGDVDIGFKSKDGEKSILIEIDDPGNPIKNALKIWIYSYKKRPENLVIFFFHSIKPSKKPGMETGEEIIFKEICELLTCEGHKVYEKNFGKGFSKTEPVTSFLEYIKRRT